MIIEKPAALLHMPPDSQLSQFQLNLAFYLQGIAVWGVTSESYLISLAIGVNENLAVEKIPALIFKATPDGITPIDALIAGNNGSYNGHLIHGTDIAEPGMKINIRTVGPIDAIMIWGKTIQETERKENEKRYY